MKRTLMRGALMRGTDKGALMRGTLMRGFC